LGSGFANTILGSDQEILVRVASSTDADAVAGLLCASYPTLLASSYEAALLAQAIPFLVRPAPTLLAGDTWYVAEFLHNPGRLAGCGGWTSARPDGGAEPDRTLAHVRHFATDPKCVRQGVGRALFARCLADARTSGVRAFECQSTLVAEPFYAALGFERVGPINVRLGGRIDFPGVRMRLRLEEER
jgi:GNAT superfamily N-acetyltransferase